jgi:peptidyl-prolyl cis-trans isomerase B (cyclophilin B)
MYLVALLGALLSPGLSPAKVYCPPDGPVPVTVKADGEERLVLTRFGSDAELGSKDVTGESTPNLKELFPQVKDPGCFVLYLVPKGKKLNEFSGTPLVVNVREDKRPGANPGPMVTKVEPLQYAVMTTKQGPLTMAFYYDVAPITTNSFLTLAGDGFFDGLTFHRIIKGFVIQGGDPRGDGTGGPGYNIEAEFNDRPHVEGVLSMARNGDPEERSGAMPRCEYANSAGSQFFICLNYANTKSLDRKYTAFGKVTAGLDAVKEIGAVATGEGDRPIEKQVIEKVQVKPVTAAEDPYIGLLPQ